VNYCYCSQKKKVRLGAFTAMMKLKHKPEAERSFVVFLIGARLNSLTTLLLFHLKSATAFGQLARE
jgi:uncharacterized membrane protein YsdA (DUF1294 family)